MSEPLAIIGISCLFPKADDLQSYWRNIKHGVDAITPIPASHWNAADYFNADPKAPDQTYAQRGGFLSPHSFNPMEFGIAPKDVEATDTTQLLGLVAAKQALADAGYAEKPFPKERTSVILGVTGALELVIPLGARLGHPIWRRALKEAGVAEPVAEDVVQRIADSYVGWQENSFPGLLGNVAAGRIANRLDLGGTNCVVDAACASSMAALHLAAMELTSGRSDMVITGGVDTFNDIFMYVCFSKTPALSPTGDAKPFDRDCDGTILGEGLGMLVLKRLADAERDGDRIYAVIKGLGTSSDGRGNAIYAPSSDGQKEALRRAYAEAGVTPDSIELVEAHGTGTKVGDATELESLTEVFRAAQADGTWAALGSVKSQIGHTKAAAGVAGLIKAALALDHKVLPPTIKVRQPIDEVAPGKSPFYVNTQKRPWLPRAAHPRRAGVSAFGFGGTNFHCVLEEHGTRMERPGWDGDVEILALSADTREALRSELGGLPAAAPWSEVRTRAAQSRKDFRPQAEFRLLLPVSLTSPLSAARDAAVKMLEQHPEKAHWTLPNGVAFGSGQRRGKLGALFPGQGSQYVGMFRDLACQFPGMTEALAAADVVFGAERPELGTQRLSDFIYPHPAFTDEARREQEAALKSTDIAQPALGAAGLGALSVLGYFGVTAEAAAGHSYGELLALCGAGRLEPEALHRLSNVRGRLMANRNGHSDRGAMLAVQASEATVNSFVGEESTSLVIANRNSPSQFVLAGSKTHIERAAGELARRSLRAKVLPVSAAFHSAMVADAREPFAAALADVQFSQGSIPVYANSTAKAYPSGAQQARELLASQIVQPVNFMAQIETMLADGVTTFVEMGPGHVLSDLVQAIAQGREVEAIALDASKGSRSGTFDLAAALCRLAALGHQVELSRWEDPVTAQPAASNGKPGFAIALTGANHRNPSTARPARRVSSPGLQPADSRAGILPAVPQPERRPPARLDDKPARVPAGPEAGAPRTLPADLADALQVAQQGMIALQKMQEQTAQLHQRFLENQDAARRTLEALLNQRRGVLQANGKSEVRSPKSETSPKSEVRNPNNGSGLVASPVSTQSPPSQAPAKPAFAPQPAAAVRTSDFGLRTSDFISAVLSVVAEKTGYPAEMLNLDMGLDSDLGIDSIKRVEIMAALRGRLPAAPEIEPEHLGTLQTLQQVVDFLSAGSSAPAAAPSAIVHPPSSRSVSAAAASAALLQVVAEKTGYPVEMLNLEMGLDSDLGVDSIKRVEIMAALRSQLPGAPEIKPEHLGTLQTLQQVVDFLTAGQGNAASGDAAYNRPSAAPVGPVPSPGGNDSGGTVNSIRASEALLQVVAEKTGYPAEMLNLDMGLDSDLGIDSIKRVEIMAALRSQLPGAPEIKPEHLGSLQTLRQIADFLSAGDANASAVGQTFLSAGSGDFPVARRTAGLESPAHRQAGKPALHPILHPPSTPAPTPPLHRQIVKSVHLADADQRPTLSLPRGARIWVTEDGSDLAPAVEARLVELGYSVRRAVAAELIRDPRGETPAGLVILWPAVRGDDVAVKEAFRLIQLAGPSLRQAGGILVTASRMDGAFGFGALNGNGNPISGALAGLVKTAAREWPEVHCKAVDLNPELGISAGEAAPLIEEMFRQGPVEVGISGRTRSSLLLETAPAATHGPTPPLADGDVVIVTGGARGITATTALQLAKVHRLKLVLLGRSRLTEQEPNWLSGLSDEAEIKRTLVARANGSGSPKKIAAQLREVLAQREIRDCLQQIQSTGATAIYRSVDVRQAKEVERACEEIRRELGPIRGLIHGAGVLADRKIEDKTAEQFDLVYGTKVSGLRNLLNALAGDDLRLLALFSSYTGRFGRVGQVDYAAANEVLNKIAQSVSRQRPKCRVVSFNWGPWNGGMVSEGLRKIFESEGVGLIEPDAGAKFFVREISSRNEGNVEVLALALTETPELGGRSSGSVVAQASCLCEPHRQDACATSAMNVAFEREVSVETVPCLASHVLNGRAVLPAALMIEWLGHGAVHGNPGLAFHGFENFRVLKGLVLEPGGVAHVSVLAEAGQWRDGLLRVPVRMISQGGSRQVLHASAEVLLAEVLPAVPGDLKSQISDFKSQGSNGHHTIYGDGQLFHGPHFQGIETLEACSETEMAALVKSAPAPKQWIQNPLRPGWLADPLALDSSFQMMILWSWEHREAGSLPCAIRSFRQYAAAFPKAGIRVVIQVTDASAPVVTADLHFLDRQGRLLAVAEGYECVMDQGLRGAFRQNCLPHGA